MPSHPQINRKILSAARRARIIQRRKRQSGASDDARDSDDLLLDALRHAINTQMNGIIGALEIMRQGELSAEQSAQINLAQSSADKLLVEVEQLLAPERETDARAAAEQAYSPLAGTRMILVDANDGSRSRIERNLKLHGVRIDSFDMPHVALAALETAAACSDPYRIAILDQQLSGIDGETLGTAISNAPLHRDTLIVLTSAEHGKQDAERLARIGFSAWLPKPMQQTMLLETLTMLCSCIVKRDAPRFVCAGVRLTAYRSTTENFHSFAHCKILVVDDNAVNLQVAEQMLARFGCKVDTAASGLQALQMAGEQQYDLILMDCQMPQMDGYQTTALLRARESADSHTIIIGWSAGAAHRERDTCLAIGMDDFIAKPMRLKPLNELLGRWLHTASTPNESGPRQDDELEVTREMFGDDFAELAHLFLSDSPKRLLSLHEAIDGNDAVIVAKFAHVLCGSTASIGATALAALCRELEIDAKNGMLDEAPSRLRAIESEYARIDAKLHDILVKDLHGKN